MVHFLIIQSLVIDKDLKLGKAALIQVYGQKDLPKKLNECYNVTEDRK